MDFSISEINKRKIFKSLFMLNYKDPKLESLYQNMCRLNRKRLFPFVTQILIFLGLFLCTLLGVLFWIQNGRNRNLEWNFYFSLINFGLSLIMFVLTQIKDLTADRTIKNISLFMIQFCYGNFFVSLISIIVVYFKMGIEIVSFTFFIQVTTVCLLAFFLNRDFVVSLTISIILMIFKSVLLLSIHVRKAIIYYLILHFSFTSLVCGFVYMYEYITRKFLYSFFKLEKEKEYFINTMSSFNVSYFSSRNKSIKKSLKMENLVNVTCPKSDNKVNLKNIENILNHLISVDSKNKEIENFLLHSIAKKGFKFKKLVKLLAINEDNKSHYNKFVNVGVIKITNAEKEDVFFQIYMKIKISNFQPDQSDKLSSLMDIEEYRRKKIQDGLDVKIEAIFLDVTQSQLKRETQLVSIVLSRYIQEIVSPLVLLGRLNEDFKKKMRNLSNLNDDVLNEINCFTGSLKTLIKIITETINFIETFAKSQNNQIKEENIFDKKVDIRKLISDCVDYYILYLQYHTNKENIKIYSIIDGQIPQFIKTNKSYLKQIIMHLIANSIKYTFSGEIKVVCKLKSKLDLKDKKYYIEINIIDTGVGIEEEQISYINKRDTSTDYLETKNGSLLNPVSDLLSKIHSKLSIYSVKNKGSNLSFEIPIIDDYPDVLNSQKEKTFNVKMVSDESVAKSKNSNSKSGSISIDADANTIIYDKPFIKYPTNKDEKTHVKDDSKSSPSYNIYERERKRRSQSPNRVVTNNKLQDYSKTKTNINVCNIHQNNINMSNILVNDNPDMNRMLRGSESFIEDTFNILIIDDDSFYLKQLVNQINMLSYEIKFKLSVETACDAMEGLCKIYYALKERRLFYDLVLLDENMPFLSGSTFAKLYCSILTKNGFYKVPFVSVSSEMVKITCQLLDDTQSNYIEQFISKPCKKAELRSILIKYMHLKANLI